MKHITIAQKLLALVILTAALIGVMTYHEITEFRAQQFKDRHAVIEMHVNNAQSVLQYYHDMAASGEMDPAEARATALEAVGAMRYEASGYFFLLDFQGIFRVHPTTRLIGTSGMELKDKSGDLFIKKLIDVARAGGGITSYQWNKPGEDPEALFEKVSFASAFDPWQLVIGTGVYVDDIDALVAEEIKASIKFGGGVVLVLVVIALLISRSITGQLAKVRSSLDAVSKDDTEMTIPFTGARTEAGRMANSIKALQDSVRDRLELEQQQAENQRALDAERQANQAAQDAEAERQKRVVATIGEALESVASGDLSVRCDDLGAADEALRSHFNDAIGKLESAMAQVNAKGNDISMSKDEIRRASVELSQRTERQAASLEETSAALEELSSSVRLTAEGARDAAKRVVSVASETETSDAIVNDAISAMSAIEQSSAQISNIIGVIEDIAFQTNLLALNAGVEAARAGESGKGFAVVAQEVRELAQRSSAAAKDVKDQIVQSSTQVDNGVKLVGDTGEALKRIFVEIKAVRDSVSSIADSASEQDTTLRSLTSSVNEMDSTTQQNAAMAEETTACTEALATDTEQLIKMINRFRVSPQSAGAEDAYRMAS